MMIMLANTTGIRTGYLAGTYPGNIGHLFSPGAQRGPFDFMPYALDNGVFAKGDKWQDSDWIKLMDWAKLSGRIPLWSLVPDFVGDRIRTLEKWDTYVPIARLYGWPLAFAVQDGMKPSDVPAEAQVIFVGGSTEWKWRTFADWCARFPRVHIGRVNTYERLYLCHEAGAESVDGTGWMRDIEGKQYRGLVAYLEEISGRKQRHIQERLELCG